MGTGTDSGLVVHAGTGFRVRGRLHHLIDEAAPLNCFLKLAMSALAALRQRRSRNDLCRFSLGPWQKISLELLDLRGASHP